MRAQSERATFIACGFVVLTVLGFVVWGIADRVTQHSAPPALSDGTAPAASQAGARL
jgi:hypothetical protein